MSEEMKEGPLIVTYEKNGDCVVRIHCDKNMRKEYAEVYRQGVGPIVHGVVADIAKAFCVETRDILRWIEDWIPIQPMKEMKKMTLLDVDAMVDQAASDGPIVDMDAISKARPNFTNDVLTGQIYKWCPVLIGCEWLGLGKVREAWLKHHSYMEEIEVPCEICFGYVVNWFAILDGGAKTAWVSVPSMTFGISEDPARFSPGDKMVYKDTPKDEIDALILAGYDKLQSLITERISEG
jgi:hypothetical protein